MTEPKNHDHTGGGEQNRRKQKGGSAEVEKNPPQSQVKRGTQPGAENRDRSQQQDNPGRNHPR